jgi:hypothetical protein
MIGLEDRQSLAHDIHTAHKAGARLRLASYRAMAGSMRYARNRRMR